MPRISPRGVESHLVSHRGVPIWRLFELALLGDDTCPSPRAIEQSHGESWSTETAYMMAATPSSVLGCSPPNACITPHRVSSKLSKISVTGQRRT
mmetsp:Transcript_56219/g.132484  ORF Transcript_56219/g.132484 Transcript_56219/m.132484 type:complete len:95 (+) Transcript_56219:191-475(+)